MPNTRGGSRGSHPKPFTSRSIPKRRGGSSIIGRGREIANEWSLRGRGNNSSSGNGREIPDECSPIERGSNNSGNGRGRADDCSPRGRGSNNTFGNDRGRVDDCSLRGRGSNNTSGNDEWCLSPYIFGDERLDVHEDNEEYTEHVIGSSQNQVGFYDPAISRHAVRLIKTMFKGAYATWTKVPQDHRDRSFIDGRMQKAIRFVMLRNLI
ncbi:hypothetical protein Tco_1348275 [Tanacetum coccineum]